MQLFQNILTSTELRFPQGALEELHPDCVDLCRSLLRKNPGTLDGIFICACLLLGKRGFFGGLGKVIGAVGVCTFIFIYDLQLNNSNYCSTISHYKSQEFASIAHPETSIFI